MSKKINFERTNTLQMVVLVAISDLLNRNKLLLLLTNTAILRKIYPISPQNI